jgi:hypothetical protein
MSDLHGTTCSIESGKHAIYVALFMVQEIMITELLITRDAPSSV